jgi:uncharacterized membrane protein YdjX (TVP38/TMEM64 family)
MRKLAAVAAVLAVLGTAYALGVFERLSDPASLARALVEMGGWGYLAFILAYALIQPFGVPGTVFVVAAALIWPWPIAFALSMTGTMAASVVGFSFARYVARDWVSKRIPARLRKYDDALEKRGLVTVFLLRFVLWMPPLLHASLGVSKVRFSTHFWGSLFGYLVPLFLMSFFGQKLFDALKSAPPAVWISLVAGALAAGAVVLYVRSRRKMRPEPREAQS